MHLAELSSNQLSVGSKGVDVQSDGPLKTIDNGNKNESPTKVRILEKNETRIPAPRSENTDDNAAEKDTKVLTSSAPSGGVRPIDQLKYLADLLKFEVIIFFFFAMNNLSNIQYLKSFSH